MKKFVLSVATVTSVMGVAYGQDPTVTTLPQNTADTSRQQYNIVVNQNQAADANPTQAQAQAQSYVRQPVTVIEASPLKVSKADEMRKAREASELETEQKIVEKLEESRLEDERRRQDAILGSFGGKAAGEAPPAPQAEVVAPPPQPQVVVVPVQQPQVVEAPRALPEIREELRAEKKEEKTSRNYVAGFLGMYNYDGIDIEPIGTMGVAFGKTFDDRMEAAFSVGYGTAYVNETEFLYRKLNQFNLGVDARFRFLTGRIRPTAGFGVTYINRNYSEIRDWGGPIADDKVNSWAVDYGFILGLDVAMSDDLSFGLEYRYMTNLTYSYDEEFWNTPIYRNSFPGFQPIEERDSDFLGFSMKYMF